MAVAQHGHHRVAANNRLKAGMGMERFQLGAKEKHRLFAGAVPAVIQRLFPQPVTGQRQGLVLLVPQRNGEHAVQLGQCLFQPPQLDARDQNFGVGRAAPGRGLAGGLDLRAQLLVVIDLAIIGQHIAPRDGAHWLRPRRA